MLTEILIPISGAFLFSVLVTVIILHALSEMEDDEEYNDDEHK